MFSVEVRTRGEIGCVEAVLWDSPNGDGEGPTTVRGEANEALLTLRSSSDSS